LQEFLYSAGVFWTHTGNILEDKVNVFFSGSLGNGTKMAIQKFLNMRGALIRVNGKFGNF
jgi:hypothetical protein